MSPELWLCQAISSGDKEDELTQSLPSRSSQPGQGPNVETDKWQDNVISAVTKLRAKKCGNTSAKAWRSWGRLGRGGDISTES